MIKDTKQVKSIQSNAPKKGWKIEWADGKFDYFFDEAWLSILDEAQKSNTPVYIEKEKNQAGYWNIITLKPAEKSDLVKEAVTKGAEVVSITNTKDRAVAMSYAKDLAVAGKIELKEMPRYADAFLIYILNKRREDKTTE